MMSKIESMQPRLLQNLTPDEARKEDLRTSLPFLGVPEQVKRIENRILVEDGNSIPARLYWPRNELSKGREDHLGMLMYFHGGGWVVGQLDQFDEVCSKLANCSGAIVISVDYRLAPENKFPAAIDDCYLATKWAERNAKSIGGDSSKIIVGGDSAGGTLAIDTCLVAKRNGGPRILMQIPICPVTDISRDMKKYSNDKYGPSKESMDWYISQYIRNDLDLSDPLASPQFADLNGLPYALMITAGLDPLREQELDFTKKLSECGVNTSLLDYSEMVHDFAVLPSYFEEGREAIEKAGLEMRLMFKENI